MADIDERVLKMTFDNQGFEQGVDRTIDSLSKLNSSLSNIGTDSGKNVFDSLQNSANSINFDALNQAIDTINYRFSDFGVAATRVIENLTDTVLDFSTTLAKSLTIEPITAGWGEYNQLIDIARLMKANTTSTMDEINAFTDRLNEYADKTKYNFLNMAEGAKQFVQATGSLEYTFKGTGESVDLEKLVEGATNYLAMTGGSNAQLSNVLEVFGRALQSGGFNGKLSYQRLVRNGAGGKLLEDVLREAARSMGREDMMNTAIEMAGSFAESFNKQVAKGYAGWANDDVIAEALRILSDPNTAIGRKAYQASTEATTFQELMDQSYEALQSGWTRIWRSIIGDLEEAKDVWYELNIILNGAEGILTRYADWFGNLAEGWRELGGRENLITGLLDALQGILNIVEAIKDTIADLFPGLDAYNLAEASEDFGLGASKFKKWTEDLRGYFGSFIGGYDIWKEVIEDEPIHHTETYGPDYEAYTAALDAAIFPYMSEIDNWIAELIQYDKEGNFDLKATKTAIQNKDFSTTRYSTGDKDLQKDLKSIQKLLTSYVEYVYGGNPTSLDTYSRKYYNYGAMASEYYDTLSEEAEYRQMDLAILRELGVNTIELENQIRDSLTTVEEWDEPQSHEERKHSARVVQGNDWFQQYIAALWDDSLYQEGAVDGVVEIYNTSQSLVKVVYALTSGLRYVWDTVKNIYDIMVKPLVSSVLTQAIHSIIEVVSRFAERFTKFINGLRSSYFFENIAYNITRIINQSANFQTFFDKVTAVLLKINTIFWDLIDNAGTLFSIITNNETLRTIGYYADYIWNYILGPLISNDVKAGAAAGGILGSLFGAIKGFFTGGPFGMIVGGIQGLISGATKGGVLGKITGVLDYLLNHTSEFTNVLKRFKDRIAELWEAFAKGFKSVTIGENNPIRKFFEWIITALGNIKNAITSADPLGAINEFLNSETMDNIIETLKSPFESAGEFIGNIVEFISTNVGSFFNTIGTKWEAYMKQFNNNPLEAFFNMVKDSALVSAIRSLGETILECFNSFKEGLLGVEETGDGKLEEKLSLFTRFTNWFRNLEKELNLYKTNPFTKTSIKDILNGFKLIGYAIRQLYNVISSGDLFGIIIDGFSILGEVVGSLINGIRKVPDKIGELFSSGDAESKSFSERVHDIKESLDEFLQSDAITQLKEKFYSFGETVSGFFSDAIEFGKTTIGGFFEFITNNKVIDFFGEVKETIAEFAKALIEGFTGVDLKDNVTGFFETLTEKLREFKESDAFDEILNKIKSIGQKISDLFAWFNGLFSSEKKEGSGGLFSGLTGWLSEFSLPKLDTKKTEKAVEEAVENIAETTDDAIQNNEKEHKTKSGIGYVFESILGGLFGANVSASELDEYDKEALQGVADGVNNLNKATKEVTKDVPKPDESEEASDNIGGFIKALSTVAKIVTGAGGAVILGAIVLFFTAALPALKGILNVVGVVNTGVGYVRAKTLIKYIEAVGLIVAAIAGLAIVLKMIGPDYGKYLTTAIEVVAGVVIAIFSLMTFFSQKGEEVQRTLTNKPFELFSVVISSIADGIEDIMKKIAIAIPIAAFVAAIVVIGLVIARLAQIDPEPFYRAGAAVGLIAAALIVFMLGVQYLAKNIESKDTFDIGALSASVIALGAGVFLVSQSIIQLVELFKDYKSDNNSLAVLGAVIASLVVSIVILFGGLKAMQLAVGKNPLKIASVVAAAIGVIAVGVAIKLMVSSIDELIEAVSKSKLDYGQLAIVLGSLAAIVLALGGFVKLAGEGAVAFRSMAALLVLTGSIKLLMGAIKELLTIFTEHFDTMVGKSDKMTGAESFMNVMFTMVALIVALGGAIKLMQGPAVKLRTAGAILGLVAGVAIVLAEIKEIFNILKDIPVEKDGLGAGMQFAIALGGIVAIIYALVKAVKALQQKELKDKEKTSTGFLAAISAIILMRAVYMALGAIKDLKGMKMEEYKTAIEVIAGILIAVTAAVAILQKTSKGADSISTVITIIALIGGVYAAISKLDYAIKDISRITAIAEALSMVVGVVGIITIILTALSNAESKSTALTTGKETSKSIADDCSALIEILAIVAAAGVALTLMANNIEETDKLMDIVLAMTEFIGALAVLTYVIAQIGPLAGGVDAGLAAVGKVAGVIAVVITIISVIWEVIQELRESDIGAVSAVGEFLATPAESIGKLLTDLAGFIGDLVRTFKEHSSIVNDSDAIVEGANSISTAVNDFSVNLEGIDPTKIDKVKEVIESFRALESAMMDTATQSINGNALTTFGTDLGGLTEPLSQFFTAILGIQNSEGNSVDLDQLASLCTAIEQVAGIQFDEKSTWFTKTVGIGEIGNNLAALGKGLYSLYSYAVLMPDDSAITRAVSIIETLGNAFGEGGVNIGDENYGRISNAASMAEEIASGVASGVDKLKNVDPTQLNTLGVIIQSLAGIYSSANALTESDIDTAAGFFNKLNLSTILEGFSKTVDEFTHINDAIESIADEFTTALYTAENADKFKGVGTIIATDVLLGIKSYTSGEEFATSIGFIVDGLQDGIENKEESVLNLGKYLATKLKEGFDNELIIESPSKEFFARGFYIVQGLINGIEESAPDALEKMRELGAALGMAFSDSVEKENIFEHMTEGKLLLKQNERNKNNRNNLNNKSNDILYKYNKYQEKSASTDTDSNKLLAYRLYKRQLDDLYSNKMMMPDDVKKVYVELNRNIKSIEEKLPNKAKDDAKEEIVDAAEEVEEKTESMADTFKSGIDDIIENVDFTDIDSIKEAGNALTGLLGSATDWYGGFANLISDEEGEGFYSYFTDARDMISESYSDLITKGTNYIKKQTKTFLKDLGIDDQIDILGSVTEMMDIEGFGGSLLDAFKEFTDISVTSKDLEKIFTGFLGELLSNTGLEDFDPKIFTQLANDSGDINDLFNSLVSNGYGGSISELVDSLAYLQEGLGSIGADSTNSDFYGDISALLGFDPQATGKSAGGAIGEYLGEAIETGVEEAAVDSRITDMAWRVISGEFGNNPDRQRLLEELGMSFEVIQNEVNRLLGCNYRYATSSEDLQRTLAALGDTALEVEDAVINTSDALVDMGTGESLKQFSDEDIVRGAQSIDTIREKLGDLISEYFEFSKYADKNGLKRDASKDDLERDAKNLEELNNIKKAYYSDQWRAANEGREADTSALVEGLTKYIEEHGDDYANVTSLIENLLSEIESGEVLSIRESMNQIINALMFASDESKVEFNEMVQAAMRAVSDGDIEAARQLYLQALAEFEQAKGYASLSDEDVVVILGDLVEATKTVANAAEVANDDNFKGEPTITKVVDQPDPDYSGLPGILPNGTGKVPLNFSDSVGFDNVNSIAGKFDRSLDDNTKVLASLENIYSELGLLKDAWYDAKVVLDTGVLVGELTPGINQQLQTNQSRRERGI